MNTEIFTLKLYEASKSAANTPLKNKTDKAKEEAKRPVGAFRQYSLKGLQRYLTMKLRKTDEIKKIAKRLEQHGVVEAIDKYNIEIQVDGATSTKEGSDGTILEVKIDIALGSGDNTNLLGTAAKNELPREIRNLTAYVIPFFLQSKITKLNKNKKTKLGVYKRDNVGKGIQGLTKLKVANFVFLRRQEERNLLGV